MKRLRLTKAAKRLLFGAVVVVTAAGVVKFGGFSIGSSDKSVNSDKLYEEAAKIEKAEDTLNISVDEWIGWKPIIDANGGLKTKKGSIYDQLGLKLNLSVINDATQSSNALIKGDLDGAGYTVNRLAFLYPKFKENNTEVVMPYINNSSTGGDGIIAKKDIKKVEDLVGKTIGVPRFSEAQTLVEWLLSKSELTDDQIKEIRNNMKFFDTPDDCAKAFFSGELDAAATWQPYLSEATQTTDAHVLFDTTNATSIILDGIVFSEESYNENKEAISKLIEGATKAESLYDTEMTAIKNTFPMFATTSNDDIKGMVGDATLTNVKTNVEMLKDGGTACALFDDMSDIWTSIGEKADKSNTDAIFEDELVKELAPKFENETIQAPTFTEEQRQEAQNQSNDEALLSQSLSIEFANDSATISEESYEALSEFANTAKILNGVVIQIEGNTDNNGNPDYNLKLSQQRAKSVATYLQYQGVDPTRFVVVGNGQENPKASNDTEEGKKANRRTDIFFKVVK